MTPPRDPSPPAGDPASNKRDTSKKKGGGVSTPPARKKAPAATASARKASPGKKDASKDSPARSKASGSGGGRKKGGEPPPPAARGWRGRVEKGLRRLRDALLGLIILGTAIPAAQAALLNVVNPPLTLTMLERSWDTWRAGGGLHLPEQEWVPIEQIPDHVVQAAISSEDAHFFTHNGFDWAAIEQAMSAYDPEESTGGGSSISQQTAKNVFLWQGRSWLRKGLEVWYTFWMELLVPKPRIMEVYLNVAETGPMTFGVQAGARHWFHKGVTDLSPSQSARMICVLPSPNRWSVEDGRVQRRAQRIVAQPSPIPPRWRENIIPQPENSSSSSTSD